MEKNVLKYFAPQLEVLELYTEGVLCMSGDNQKPDFVDGSYEGGN